MKFGPDIVTDSLELLLDADSSRCYPGTGTSLTDLSKLAPGNFALSGATVSNGHFSFSGQGETDGDPQGDQITLSDTSAVNVQSFNDNGVTYEIWLNPDVNERRSLFFGSGTINHLEIYCGSSGGSVRTEARYQNGYSFGANAPTGGFPINTWTQLDIVFDEHAPTREVRWYKNGTLFHTHSDFYNGTTGNTEDFWFSSIGRATGSASYLYAKSWSGLLNSFKVYSKALSASEIQKNFNAQKRRFGL